MRGRAGLEKREGREKKGLPPLLLQMNSPSAQQREIPIGCCLVKLSSPKGFRALVFCCDYIINMAASCTNADVLATVIQKLGGLITCGGSVSAMGKKSTSISTNSRPVKRATPKCSTRHFKISHRKCLSFELYLFHPIDCFVSSKTHSTVSLTVPLAD